MSALQSGWGRFERIQSIHELRAMHTGNQSASLRDTPTSTLLARIATTADPVKLWHLHMELDRRSVPPCARHPTRDETPMLGFVSWLADVLWIMSHYPGHCPSYQQWENAFRLAIDGEQWHRTMLWHYVKNTRPKKPHYYVKGLGLSERQRQPLLVLQNEKARPIRRLLADVSRHAAALMEHAHKHPDKAGQHPPKEVALRRLAVLRCYLMAAGNSTLACELLALLTGESMSRPFLIRQMEKVRTATGLKV